MRSSNQIGAVRPKPNRLWILGIVVLAVGCDGQSQGDFAGFGTDDCNVDASLFADGGVGVDGIPALLNPEIVDSGSIDYLEETSRVIGIVADGQPIAVPHNILWWHEIANFNLDSGPVAVTYCPLTGSSLAFDRSAVGGDTFGVSGLLFKSNLTMYNRSGSGSLSTASLWPQMNIAASCGPATAERLPTLPSIEMTWAGWKELHPDTQVLSEATGFSSRNYTFYPYGDYEIEDNPSLLVQIEIDQRRPPKERVLGVPSGQGGVAYPFGELDADASSAVVSDVVSGERVVVMWDHGKRAAAAYLPDANGQQLTFVEQSGQIVDNETGSVWTVDGRASEGDLAGARLIPITDAYVAFWFAWAAFQPDTEIWVR